MKPTLALLVALVACGDTYKDRRFKDGKSTDVDTATPCSSDGDCADRSGWSCASPGDIPCQECVEVVRACETADDCEDGYVCRNFEVACSCSGEASDCYPACHGDSECPSGYECDIDNGQCLPASCLDGFACPPGSTCTGVGSDHGCNPILCSADADCGDASLYCVNGGCYDRYGACYPDGI